jgi:endonuclease/exonuclease/phosphatase family metal-dependent hydrolase
VAEGSRQTGSRVDGDTLLSFMLAIPLLLWVQSHSLSTVGAWTLPVGLLLPWAAAGCTLAALVRQARESSSHRWIVFGLLNLLVAMEDFRIRTPATEGTPILTWNVSVPKRFKNRFPCVSSYLQEWTERNAEGIILLQEIQQVTASKLEEELGMQCRWSPYQRGCEKKNWCAGLMICAPDSWTFSRTHHRPLSEAERYGFLQTELRSEGFPTFNVMNVHLESLWKTSLQKGSVANRNDFTWKHFAGNPGLLWQTLRSNAYTQRHQIAELYDVLEDLKDPVLLVGDFNSTSSMWMHRRLRRSFPSMARRAQVEGLKDAHKEAGIGFGASATRRGLSFRIDNLYAQPPLEWSGPTRVRKETECSDHWPIEAWLRLEEDSVP